MLREYQAAAINSLRSILGGGNRRPVLVSPTGSGKTVMAVEIVRLSLTKGRRVLFLAPRRELIYQAARMFARRSIAHGLVMAGEAPAPWRELQIASFDTLHARGVRDDKIEMPEADLVVVDEAHLSIAKSRRDIIEHYADKVVIGLTATPARGDGRGLGEIYDSLVSTASVGELTRMGYLVPVRYFAPSKPDLDGLKLNSQGDYVERGLAERVDKVDLVGDVVHNWQRIAKDRQTVVFAVNRAHSRHLCEEFKRAGYVAEHLDGETPLDERKAILQRLESGVTQILCNVFVATFGLDIPSLSCAVLARPTRNITLYLQTAGRVLRICEGKKDAIIIDHAGAVEENGFVDDEQPWSLDERSKVKDRKAKQQAERGEPKQITCDRCHTAFAGQRDCPNCGQDIVGKSQPVPTHQADLQEMRKENRKVSMADKQKFYGELKGIQLERGYSDGWVSHSYRKRFSVWPNKIHSEPLTPSEETRNYVKHLMIANAKRRAA